MNFETNSKIDLQIFDSRAEMGRVAGADVETQIAKLLEQQEFVRVIFAAAPSQNEVLDYLVASEKIDWSRIEAFHMDEYIGLSPEAPQAFSKFLRDRLFDRVEMKAVHLIDGNNDPDQESCRYTELLRQAPVDVVCMGIGENGHIAFNDPPVADFQDPAVMKSVALDDMCRQQQVNDGCFASFDEVPSRALTLTVPALMAGATLFCVVPGSTKKNAVYDTITATISTECPASILQTHAACRMYTDRDSASLLGEE